MRRRSAPASLNNPGSDLLSHAVANAVPSAQEGLTSVFGMGTGVAPPAMPPGIELSRQRAAPNTEILERSQALSLSSSSSDENYVVKPHGRLVPVS
jgi:hypothetical protein